MSFEKRVSNAFTYIRDKDFAIVCIIDLHRHLIFHSNLKDPVRMRYYAEPYIKPKKRKFLSVTLLKILISTCTVHAYKEQVIDNTKAAFD